MNRKLIAFTFALFIAGVSFAQDTTSTKKNDAPEITGERRRNPNTKPNPHPAGIVTGVRTRNPAPKEEPKQKNSQPVISEERKSSPEN
jgi:hypothetical protein